MIGGHTSTIPSWAQREAQVASDGSRMINEMGSSAAQGVTVNDPFMASGATSQW